MHAGRYAANGLRSGLRSVLNAGLESPVAVLPPSLVERLLDVFKPARRFGANKATPLPLLRARVAHVRTVAVRAQHVDAAEAREVLVLLRVAARDRETRS